MTDVPRRPIRFESAPGEAYTGATDEVWRERGFRVELVEMTRCERTTAGQRRTTNRRATRPLEPLFDSGVKEVLKPASLKS